MNHSRFAAILAAIAAIASASAQKKPLDHAVYDDWKSIGNTTLSRDGSWILYRIAPQEGDAVVEIQKTSGGEKIKLERASNPQFSRDGKFVVTLIAPKFADTQKARRDKGKPEDMPKSDLAILDLASGKTTTIPKVASFDLAEKDSGYLAYRPEPPKPTPAKPPEKKEEPKGSEGGEKKEEKPAKKTDHKPGDPLVLRNLASGAEQRIESVSGFRFSEDGKTLILALSTKDGKEDGIVWMDVVRGTKTKVVQGLGRYPRLMLDKAGKQLAFLTDKDDYSAKKPGMSVYLYQPGGNPKLVAKEGSAGLPSGYWLPDNSTLRFSESGKRLFFSAAPKPPEEKKDDTPEDEKVQVDVWNWQDPTLQPQQLLRANAERNRTYEMVVNVSDPERVMVLETPDLSSVTVSDRGDGRYALGSNGKPYEILASWDTSYRDYVLIDLVTGARKTILEKSPSGFGLSPTGKYVFGYDEITKEGVAFSTANPDRRVVTKDLPYPIWDELNDVPSPAGSYGVAGWTPDDARVLVYDRYDIWAIDPEGKAKPVCVTNGYGRLRATELRYVPTEREATHIDPSKPMLLRAMEENSKDSGFFWDGFGPTESPRRIVMAPKRFTNPVQAEEGKTVTFTRQDFVEYPDIWVADNFSLENARKISDANPQQKDYNWGTAELITWRSNDNVPLQGILIKPENFDYAKKYPMIAYFYERNSDTLHSYRTPSPTASILNPTMAASNGYVVFIPDIPYKIGYPGESAVSAILPGVQAVLQRGYVDPDRLAIDGQSWGGYQVAYLVTETNMFQCAYAGAPVANMFSAYGGIRWGSGLVRQFQYERTQSRLGESLWDRPLRYLENSPLFFLDKVQTPLLIMHNDKDGAVPWYQGIELFTGLRRLQKPSWLLVYNNEDHNLVQRKNRKDLSIRKQQFYDHYLKGAPMPDWMKTGIPAVEKGKNMGLGTGN